jgi:tetratricopeptide (TPR) repeat protein
MKYLIFLLLITTSVFSQKSTSLSQKEYLDLQEKVRALTNSNVDSAFIFANKIESSDIGIHKSFALAAKSYLFQIKGDNIKSKLFYKGAIESLKSIQPSYEKTKQYTFILNYGGLADWKRGGFSDALVKYQKGKKLSLSINDQIQVVKFNNNIALINGEVGNYKQAIEITKQSDRIIDKIEYLYQNGQFNLNKGNINLNLGKYYEDSYKKDTNKIYFIDSASHYYRKAIIYSKEANYNRVVAQMNLANIYYIKNDIIGAEKIYQSVLMASREYEFNNEYFKAIYNLGDLNYHKKDFQKALFYFEKVDSVYYSNKTNPTEFLKSNYYQAKVYNAINNLEKAAEHSEIYLDNYEKNVFNLNKEITEVNSNLSNEHLQSEMKAIQSDFKFKNGFNYLMIFVVSIVILLILVVVNDARKKANKKRINDLPEFKSLSNYSISEVGEKQIVPNVASFKNSVSLISVEKEKEILDKLSILEKKLDYIKPDFTQQYVAKKIKTNTAYLSNVVNRHYNKSFSEYLNELRVNYVINEMVSNPTYRKYSTQAIAESVGYKNAVSFTKSFNKKTGLTPHQFIKNIEESVV